MPDQQRSDVTVFELRTAPADRPMVLRMGLFRRKPTLTDEQRAQLRETAWEWIAPGFRAREGLAEELIEFRDDIEVPGEVMLDAAREVIDEVWRERLAEEATWPDTGDFDALVRAFAALTQQGMVCRMDFTCCQTCGMAEIDDERTPRAAAVEDDYPYEEWAYTFFHQQDSERLVQPEAILYLSYSAFRPAPGVDPDLITRAKAGDEDARRDVVALTDTTVGEMVRDALVAEGLVVDWNGTNAQRIGVRLPNWRKPLPQG
jgi:hypothetical protein